jgi:hypothetical protein
MLQGTGLISCGMLDADRFFSLPFVFVFPAPRQEAVDI